jgi:uncharacterized protein
MTCRPAAYRREFAPSQTGPPRGHCIKPPALPAVADFDAMDSETVVGDTGFQPLTCGASGGPSARAHASPFAPVDRTKSVTFVVTQECNLRCSYCYMVHKNRDHRMSFDVARAAVDYLLTHHELFGESAVVWDFIGGEPFLELPLIERIVTYALLRSYELEHPWFMQSQFTISTNGLLYGAPAVQRFIGRYREFLDVTISIDGPEEVHDRARVTASGEGSYGLIRDAIPLWLRQFPRASTKVTIARENLGDVARSVLHLFALGITRVLANVVFENVWHEGDDVRFEEQLDRLGDEMVRTGLWKAHSCSLFQRGIGTPLDPSKDGANWCGSGRMLAIDADGTFYPCVRFLPFTLTRRVARNIGNVREGLAINRARPFLALTVAAQSRRECLECRVAKGCAWCQGLNYDQTAMDTIYERATYLCRMHKARVRANERFWARIDALPEEGA